MDSGMLKGRDCMWLKKEGENYREIQDRITSRRDDHFVPNLEGIEIEYIFHYCPNLDIVYYVAIVVKSV